MKKSIICLLALALAAAVILPAQAKTFTGRDDWQVSFTREKELASNFRTSDMDDLVQGMQPGDQAIITLRLANQHSASTNWYMTNEVLSSPEDSRDTASGGAYTYRLVYTGSDGAEDVLFDSDTVGGDEIGEAGEGLNEATSGLEDFFLDTLTTGQSGVITLTVALEGETQGNGYQDTLADLQMNFAVELNDDNTTTVVVTGDSDMLPYIVAAAVSGALLLAYAVYSLAAQRRQRKGR